MVLGKKLGKLWKKYWVANALADICVCKFVISLLLLLLLAMEFFFEHLFYSLMKLYLCLITRIFATGCWFEVYTKHLYSVTGC